MRPWMLLLSLVALRVAANDLHAVEVARGLDNRWPLAALPAGRMLVTDRPGRRWLAATG